MDAKQGKPGATAQPSPEEIAELVGLWAVLSEDRRKAVLAFARVVARETKAPVMQDRVAA
jgi:hypothetical protein